jgi:hypothetical protein
MPVIGQGVDKMPTHQAYQQNVLSFLKNRGASNHLIDLVGVKTSAFYSFDNRYGPLLKRERVSEDIIRAVSLATGKRPEKVEYFSFSSPPPCPGEMSRYAQQMRLRRLLCSTFEDSLAHNLKEKHEKVISDRLESADCQMLSNSLRHNAWMIKHMVYGSLWEPIWGDDLWKSILQGAQHHLFGDIQQSIWLTLFYFHAYVLLNDDAAVELMTPLIEEISKSTPPFGFKHNERKTLLVPAK